MEAQNHAHLLGLALKISPVDVIAIVDNNKEPLDRLLHIILKFLSQSEPPPTWRAIVNALKSKAVNLTALAKRVEAAHFPDPTASRDPPTTSGESANTPNPYLQTCHILQLLQPMYIGIAKVLSFIDVLGYDGETFLLSTIPLMCHFSHTLSLRGETVQLL